MPRYAYAAPSLEVDGNFAGYEDGEEYKGYVVVDSPDNYQSTLCLIGEYGKLIQITTEQYETLSNPSTGGAFYELSQQWKKIGTNKSGTESYYPQWLALSEDYADGLVTVYGYGRVWAAVCTDELIEHAKDDFNTILDGGTVGGGGSGGASLGTVLKAYRWNSSSDGIFIGSVKYYVNNNPLTPAECNLSLGEDLSEQIEKYDNCDTLIQLNGWNNLIRIWCIPHNKYTINTTIYNYSGGSNEVPTSINVNDEYYTVDINYISSNGYVENDVFYYVNNETKNFVKKQSGTISMSNITYFSDIDNFQDGGGGSDEPSPDPWEPPTPTPDPPSNPTTPTPKDPITPDPPSLPGAPSDPVQPAPPQSPTVGDGGTFTVDIQGILDALDEHCIHIQTCLNANFSGQNSYLGELFSTYTAAIVDQIYNGDVSKIGAIGDLQNTVTQGFNDILSYWDDYVEWLDKKLDFKIPETDAYDDKDLINWIRKIWARQGSGDVNTRPVDPATNYVGMSKWLGVLYGEIAGDVSDTSLTALSSSLNALQHTFPFSLPWDIQQILQALDATPATPAASITVPALAGAWDAYSYDIDLHWMDSPMVAVRGFELLAFVLYCLVHTKEVFGYVVGD